MATTSTRGSSSGYQSWTGATKYTPPKQISWSTTPSTKTPSTSSSGGGSTSQTPSTPPITPAPVTPYVSASQVKASEATFWKDYSAQKTAAATAAKTGQPYADVKTSSGATVRVAAGTGKVIATVLPSGKTVSSLGQEIKLPVTTTYAVPAPTLMKAVPLEGVAKVAKEEYTATDVSSIYKPALYTYPGMPSNVMLQTLAGGKQPTVLAEKTPTVRPSLEQPTLSQKYMELVKGPVLPFVRVTQETATSPLMRVSPDVATLPPGVDWSKISGVSTLPTGLALQTVFTKRVEQPQVVTTPKLPELPEGLKESVFWTRDVAAQQYKERVETGAQRQTLITQKQLEKTTQDKMSMSIQREKLVGEINTIIEKEINPLAAMITERNLQLLQERETIDPTNTAQVANFNKKLDALQLDKDKLQTRMFDARLLEEQTIPLDQKIDKLEKQENQLVGNIYDIQRQKQQLEKSVAQIDKLKEREKILWSEGGRALQYAGEKISSPGVINKITGVGIAASTIERVGLGELGLGTLQMGRNIGKAFFVNPARIIGKDIKEATAAVKGGDWEVAKKELIDVGIDIAPGALIARGVYDWRSPEAKEYGWKASTSWEGVTGLVEGATLGLGALAGVGQGVVVPAATTAARTVGWGSTALKVALPTITVAGIAGAPTYGYVKGQQAVGKLEQQKTDVKKLYESGGISKDQYETSTKFLTEEIANVKEQTGLSTAFREATVGAGEMAGVTLGAFTAAGATAGKLKLFGELGAPAKSNIIGEGILQQAKSRGVTSEGELSSYKVGKKGLEIEVPSLPKDTKLPFQKEAMYVTQYEEQGARKIREVLSGKQAQIKTTLEFEPVRGDYPQFNVLRVRELQDEGLKYVTTSKAGATSATTKIYDVSGKLLRTVKEAPVMLPKNIGLPQTLFTYGTRRPKPQQLAENLIWQEVATKKAVGMDVPVEKTGLRMEAEGYVTARTKQLTGVKPTIVEGAVGEVVYEKAGKAVPLLEKIPGQEVSLPYKGRETQIFARIEPTKLRIGDPSQNIFRQKITENIGPLPTGMRVEGAAVWHEKLPTVSAEGTPLSPLSLKTVPGEELFDVKLAPHYLGQIKSEGPYISSFGDVPFDAETIALRGYRLTQTPMPVSGAEQTFGGGLVFSYKSEPTIWQKAGAAISKYVGGTTTPTRVHSFATGFPLVWPTMEEASVGKWTGEAITKIPSPQTVFAPGTQYVSRLAVPSPTFKVPIGLGLSTMAIPSVAGVTLGGVALSSLSKITPTTIPTTKITPTTISTSSKISQMLGLSPVTVSAVTPVQTVIPVTKPLVAQTPVVSSVLESISQAAVTTPSISPELLGALSIPSITSPLKIPTFGGLRGSLGEGVPSLRTKRGINEWLIANKIATYGEDWFAKQQAKAATASSVFKGTGSGSAALAAFTGAGEAFGTSGSPELVGRVPVADRFSYSYSKKPRIVHNVSFVRHSFPSNFRVNVPSMSSNSMRMEDELTPRQHAQSVVERGFGKVVSLKTPGKMQSLFKNSRKRISLAGKI